MDINDKSLWKKIENEFYQGAKKTLTELAKSGRKERKLRFWKGIDGDYAIFAQDLDIALFEAPIINEVLQEAENAEDPEIDSKAVQHKLFDHCSTMIAKLGTKKCFDPLIKEVLDVCFETEDTNEGLIASYGDANSAASIFTEASYDFDLSKMDENTANDQWWIAKHEGTSHNHEINYHGEEKGYISNNIETLDDWMKCSSYFVMSSRLCALLQKLGVENIECHPIKVSHEQLGQSSETYYQNVKINTLIKSLVFYQKDKDAEFKRRNNGFSSRFENLYIRKKAIEKTALKLFLDSADFRPNKIVVNNNIKLACEANNIAGIQFHKLEMWEDDEVLLYQKGIDAANLTAMWEMGRLLVEGILVEKDIEKAVSLFEQVIHLGEEKTIKEMYVQALHKDEIGSEAESGWCTYLKGMIREKRGALYDARNTYQEAIDKGYTKAKEKWTEISKNQNALLNLKNKDFWKKITVEEITDLHHKGVDFSDILSAINFGLRRQIIFRKIVEWHPEIVQARNHVNNYPLLLILCHSNCKALLIPAIDAGADVPESDTFRNAILESMVKENWTEQADYLKKHRDK